MSKIRQVNKSEFTKCVLTPDKIPQIIFKYWTLELSQEEIGQVYGVSTVSVFKFMKKHKIRVRTRHDAQLLAAPKRKAKGL